jgi:non-specific protein-tyrosine kinase
MHETQASLRHYLHVLRRQGWLIVLVVVVTLGATAFLTFRQQSEYQASMKIVVGQGGIVIGRNGSLFEPALTSDVNRFTATMTNLLKSNVVSETVVRNLSLRFTPETLLHRLRVSAKPDSSVLEVSYRANDRNLAVGILGEVGRVFTALVKERLGAGGTVNEKGQPTAAPVTTSVFDPAHADPGRVSPRPVRNLAFAGALALLLGLVLAFARESLDDRIRGRREAEEWFGAPVMGSLPKGLRGKSVPDLRTERRGRQEQVTEALDLLRANVQFAQAGLEGGTIVVTSALPEDGKSTVVANLGVTLALAGHDVICVEADLHRPMLIRYLGVNETEYGLTDVVSGRVELAKALQPVPLPMLSRNGRAAQRIEISSARGLRRMEQDPMQGRLRLLSTGKRSDRPSALLGAGKERIVSLLQELSDEASYVLLDTPPLLALADAFPFALAADTVLVVARNGRTTRQNAQAVRATLEGLGAERVAIVLTDVSGGDGYYRYGGRPASRSTIS